MAAGMQRVFAELGVPAHSVEARFVNGFLYTRLNPLVGADKPPKRLPPSLILRIVTRLHPEFRRRTERAASTFRERPSIGVARRWDHEMRPQIRAANVAFQQVDPDALDDEALEQHIGDLLDHAREHYELHFWLHGHDLGPIARYLHVCIGWGLDPLEAIDALAGASSSTARPMETMQRLRTIAENSGCAVTSLDDVRAISDEAASLLDDYVVERGSVLATGYDITSSTLVELPDVILSSILSAEPPLIVDHEHVIAKLREETAVEDRAQFDALLSDARAVMDMRDDNGPMTCEWPAGLLRRGLLSAGRRLHERGDLHDADHALELGPEEARAIFTGGLPFADIISQRVAHRVELARMTPPATLGDPELQPPIDVLPKPLADSVAMVQTALKYLGMDGSPREDALTGAGIGDTPYTGRATTAASSEEAIEKLEPGDVLIVRATSPAFNAVLAIAGAVVTTDGGALSHAAVLARELGIPAVVGASGALDIADGSTVEVDPVSGSVRVVEPA